ncbi:dimethyl sulfoxide reductase anchor subunit family protein [Vibrio owensii]|uniref:dimethyl sulfoxide reductase anchor subunit family protein n=1 Tax=Vibrio owensii TaxID=696485 RepID=UPI00059728E0|nr:DmsC/YnfH family molybdoenzyme membrane anchor subunit [Vibrio owensii]
MHEISIVVFTLLVQFSIGSSVTFACQYRQQTLVTNKVFLFVICALATLGLLISLTHLGYIWNAPYAITHVASSWLSREILFTSAFVGCFGLAFLWVFFKDQLNKWLIIAGVIFGLANLYAMSHIYTAATVVIWQSWATFASFFGAAITGLCLAAMILSMYDSGRINLWQVALLLVAALIRIYAQYDMMAGIPAEVDALGIMFPIRSEVSFAEFAPNTYYAWGVMIASIFTLAVMAARHNMNRALFVVSALGIVCAELVLRIGFYSF